MNASLHAPFGSTRKWPLVFCAWSVGWGFAPTLYGAPLYSGFVNVPGEPESVIDSPNPVVLGGYQSIVDYWGADALGTKTSAADAVASYGRIKGGSFSDYLNVSESIPGSFGNTGSFAQSSSNIYLDDLFISGPPGNIEVSLNVAISGGVFADNGGSAYVQSSAGATASTALGSDFGGSGTGLGEIYVDGNGGHTATGIFSTFPANGNGAGVGTTASILTYAGAVIRFSLKLETGANVSVGAGAGPGAYFASSDFTHTFGFPTSGPVANLPEGYTLNSISGHIVNNRFVSEPSSAAILAFAGSVMLFRRRFGRIPLPAGRVGQVRTRFCSPRKWAPVLLVGSVGLATAQTVYAAPRYSGSINTNGVGETVNSSPNAVVLSGYTSIVEEYAGNAIGTKTTGADAAAGYGRLGASSFADYLNVSEFFPIFSGSNNVAQSSSNFFLDDLVITGPPGNIEVSFNIAISGGVFADNGGSAYVQSYASAKARVINLQSSFGGAGAELGEINVNGNGGRTATGIFSTFPANGDGEFVGTTSSITTFAGDTAIQFWLGLETSASVYMGYGADPGSGYGSSDFSHTFGFPTSGQVANLPDGYNLNSLDGRIVNNRFVPEPSTLWLAGLVMAALLSWRGGWPRAFGPWVLAPGVRRQDRRITRG